jgi:hypothetical protein
LFLPALFLPFFIAWMVGLVGISLALAVRRLTMRDLALMRMGLMDPSVEVDTATAASLARAGFLLSLTGTAVWATIRFGPFVIP